MPPCSEQVVGVGPGDRRHGDHDAAALGLQPLRRALGGPHAGAALVVVGEDDDLGDVVRDLHPLEALGGERRPDRPPRREVPECQPGLDALAEDQRQAGDGLAEADRAAGGLAEHHLRLLDPRLHRLVRIEVGAVHADDRAGPVADDADQRRMAGAGVPVGEVRVEAQVGVVEDLEPALPEIGLGLRAGDRHGMAQDELDLLGGVLPARSRRRPRRHREVPGDARGMVEERGAGQPGGVLDGVDRPAAVAGLEVVPVAGVRAAQLDDAGAVPPRSVAADVGEPPLVADAAAVREERAAPRSRPSRAARRRSRRGRGAAGSRATGATSLRSIIVRPPRRASGAQQRFAQSHIRQR